MSDPPDGVDRRTVLATSRTLLAAERTYAAWVRTALAALASGVGARALLADVMPVWFAQICGSVLILFSIFCFAAAVWRQIGGGMYRSTADIRPMPRALLVAVNGLLAVVAVAALIVVWAA